MTSARFQEIVLGMQRVVRLHHGCLMRLVDDEKGIRFKVVFGLPGYAQKKHAVSALTVIDFL